MLKFSTIWHNQHNAFNLYLNFNNTTWWRVQQPCSSDDCYWLLLTRASHQALLRLRLYTGKQHDCLQYLFFEIRAFSLRNLHFKHLNLCKVTNKTWILNIFFHIYVENFDVLCVDCFWAWVSLQILVVLSDRLAGLMLQPQNSNLKPRHYSFLYSVLCKTILLNFQRPSKKDMLCRQ